MSCLNRLSFVSKHDNVLYTQAVLVIGSNHEADKHFDYAKNALVKVGSIAELPLITTPDYTHKTSTLYQNQALIFYPNLCPNQSLALERFLKTLEQDCLRQKNSTHISLDLDILLLKTKHWHIIKERHPFKHHELCCLGFDFAYPLGI